jgi:broad specificity phosphatase PhoE
LNEQNSFRSWIDVPLDAKGLQQAKAAAEWLSDKGIVNIYSSPLLRAFVTADIASRPHGLTVYQHRGLFPWRLGCFSGLSKKDNQAALRLFVRNASVAVPGGESLQEFEDRQYAFWGEALKRARAHGITLFVAHTSNLVALQNFTKEGDAIEPEDADTVRPGGIAAIYFNGKTHRVVPVFGQAEDAKFGGS